MRQIISAMQVSVDGYIEDPEARQDWVDNWEEDYGLMPQVDTCVLGHGMYDGYQKYWRAILANPRGPLPFSGKAPTEKEIVYARWADKTPHLVVSRKPLDVTWKNTRVVSDLEEIRALKRGPGKDIYVIGGAVLVSAMITADLIDEIRLKIHPILLGGGKALFKGVTARRTLKLESATPMEGGMVFVIYAVQR